MGSPTFLVSPQEHLSPATTGARQELIYLTLNKPLSASFTQIILQNPVSQQI
jgi:hypothetical protein